MNIVDKAIQTQLANIQAKTGQTLDQLRALLQQSGLAKHGERGVNADHALTRRLCDGDGDSSVPDCQLDQWTVCLERQ